MVSHYLTADRGERPSGQFRGKVWSARRVYIYIFYYYLYIYIYYYYYLFFYFLNQDCFYKSLTTQNSSRCWVDTGSQCLGSNLGPLRARRRL